LFWDNLFQFTSPQSSFLFSIFRVLSFHKGEK
jgi:hypothetical protein